KTRPTGRSTQSPTPRSSRSPSRRTLSVPACRRSALRETGSVRRSPRRGPARFPVVVRQAARHARSGIDVTDRPRHVGALAAGERAGNVYAPVGRSPPGMELVLVDLDRLPLVLGAAGVEAKALDLLL